MKSLMLLNQKNYNKFLLESTQLKSWFEQISLIKVINCISNEKNNKIVKLDEEEMKYLLNDELTTLTAIIIVKNEEDNIVKCIESIKDYVDELVIIDTGSTDNTLNLITTYQCDKIKVFTRKWKDNFSQIRNYAKSKATGKWIFYIDADETVMPPHDFTLFKKLLRKFELLDLNEKITICPVIIDHNNHKSVGVRRCFYNSKKFYYFGHVHEEVRNINGLLNQLTVDINIRHEGYKSEILKNKEKVKRNINLLKKTIKKEPSEIRWKYFYCRDGSGYLPDEEIEKMIKHCILYYPQNAITKRNVMANQYTLSFMVILAEIMLRKGDYLSLMDLSKQMFHLNEDKSNYLYYSTMSLVMQRRNELMVKLEALSSYREKDKLIHYGMLHSSGYHIDIAILILLIECGLYAKAKAFRNALEEEFPPISSILENYRFADG